MRNVVYRGQVRRLRFDPGVLSEVDDYAVATLRVARFFAPFRTGHYVGSFYHRFVGGSDPHSVIGAHDFKAWWIEFGAYGRTGAFRARAPFRRALAANRIKFISTK